MVRPDPEQFRALAARGPAVPLVREVLADLDTAVSTFLKVDDGETAFLFESVEGGEHWGRFSFIGVGARALFTSRAGHVEITRNGQTEHTELASDRSEDPLHVLTRLMAELAPVELPDLPRFAGGPVGYLAYDWVRYVEKLPDLNRDVLGVPDCHFVVPRTVIVRDSRFQKLILIQVVETPDGVDLQRAYRDGVAELDALVQNLEAPLAVDRAPPPDLRPLEITSNTSRERYHEMVKRAKDYIRAGDVFQVVPSQRMTAPLQCDPFAIYRQLRVQNPSPYLFFLRCGDHEVIGSSPEILVRLDGRDIALRPIAGTHPRGETPEEDAELERKLLSDPKELAEHVMLVDLGRNDVGRVAEIGSVHVDEFEIVERYSHVMHIVSNVRGKLRADCDAVDLLRATFPAGTLTGAPKVRAMEIIEELEADRRGLYGGCVGYLDFHGHMDMCIAIRTLLVKDEKVHIQAGGGVVADSDPEREFRETQHKASGPLKAVALASGGEISGASL